MSRPAVSLPYALRLTRWARAARTREALTGMAFLTPSFVFLTAFVYFPLIYLIYVSQLRWNLISHPTYVGLQNYFRLFQDPMFLTSVRNTVVFTVGVMVLTLPAAFVTALLLNLRLPERGLYRSAFLAPYVFPLVASGIVWTLMLQPQGGVVNWFLHVFGLPPLPWLNSGTWAMVAVILVTTWEYFGFYTLIFLAGLQSVPRDVLEAADIDGASHLKRLLSVTLPLTSPSILFALVISVIQSFQAFTQVYVMTDGGPDGATTTIVFYLYQEAFQFFQMGTAASVGVLLLLSLVVLTLLQLLASQRWVHYES